MKYTVEILGKPSMIDKRSVVLSGDEADVCDWVVGASCEPPLDEDNRARLPTICNEPGRSETICLAAPDGLPESQRDLSAAFYLVLSAQLFASEVSPWGTTQAEADRQLRDFAATVGNLASSI